MKFATFLVLILSTSLTWAAGKIPACMDKTERLSFNESRVLMWRELTEQKFVGRAFVRGVIVRLIEDRQNHMHFEVDLDGNLSTQDDRVEVIYNTKFGALTDYRIGDQVIACGDFIKDRWSPLGAVIHWLHSNPKKSAPHEHGFLIINDVIFGQIH
ncbi:hypothetical protein [Bdellovibrio sp. HCB2-146]|uniref:hypothetical protein n=1 Tax=Bdellovibrio sp. HCB2-146 TaxID=3394362 RepID=UPI0039BD43FC